MNFEVVSTPEVPSQRNVINQETQVVIGRVRMNRNGILIQSLTHHAISLNSQENEEFLQVLNTCLYEWQVVLRVTKRLTR